MATYNYDPKAPVYAAPDTEFNAVNVDGQSLAGQPDQPPFAGFLGDPDDAASQRRVNRHSTALGQDVRMQRRGDPKVVAADHDLRVAPHGDLEHVGAGPQQVP